MAVEEAVALAIRDGHYTKNSAISPPETNRNGEDADLVINAKGLQNSRCFSFVKIKLEPSGSLKDLDSDKLKTEIKKWAKAVVKFARQLSSRGFGSSRRGGGGGSGD
ncbi:hypothetical protein C5167_018320 [Papaver somniferum]|uniref:Uncharacterized protein n=1 Tax=Papaver somniferum TaxID=3469 RepID=A0A4Y7IQZ2_PAPSO|nr:hypothetical protein C5167_018320 [Papaver somniferum]